MLKVNKVIKDKNGIIFIEAKDGWIKFKQNHLICFQQTAKGKHCLFLRDGLEFHFENLTEEHIEAIEKCLV